MDFIAEVGSNHCGNLELALQHIRAAVQAGATGVKFQLFKAEKLDGRPEVQANLKPLELPQEWLPVLKQEAHHAGIKFIVTPFDVESCLVLKPYVDMVKISAYDLTYEKLVRAAFALGVPVVLSTAMATIEEVAQALSWAYWEGNVTHGVTLLHGVAAYPARWYEQHLLCLQELKKAFPACQVGLSDHTIGTLPAQIATALGATMIEKHFCLLQVTYGPDVEVSASPAEFSLLVKRCQEVQRVLGTEGKDGPLPIEMPLFTTCRRTNEKELRG